MSRVLKSIWFASAALIVAVAPAQAQQAATVVGVPPADVLRAGTQVQLTTLTELTTEGKNLKVGDRFELNTTDAVLLNGVPVIPSGSRAVGEITSVRNKGMWGKSGGITAHVLYVEANGRQLRLSGSFDDRGETGTGGVVASALLVPVVGFFVTGTSARIPPGSHVKAFLDEDVPVAFATGAVPAPMTVVTAVAATAAPIPPVSSPAAHLVTSPTAPAVVAPAPPKASVGGTTPG